MGLLGSIGGAINSITGASDSAKQSYGYSAKLALQNYMYQKEFMQNAHQWEVNDLKAAGLNPILSAGGSGASASGGGGAAISASSGAGGLSSIMNSAAGLMRLSSEIDNINSDTGLKGALTEKVPSEVKNINSATRLNNAKVKEVSSSIMLNSAKALEAKANEKFQNERARGKQVTRSMHGGFDWKRGAEGGISTTTVY